MDCCDRERGPGHSTLESHACVCTARIDSASAGGDDARLIKGRFSIAAALSLLLAAYAQLGCDDTQKKAVETANMQNSGKVVWALEAYKKDKGQYPDNLYYVTPKYFGNLPQCIGVPNWGYKTSEDFSQFTIRFPGWRYSSAVGKWEKAKEK